MLKLVLLSVYLILYKRSGYIRKKQNCVRDNHFDKGKNKISRNSWYLHNTSQFTSCKRKDTMDDLDSHLRLTHMHGILIFSPTTTKEYNRAKKPP